MCSRALLLFGELPQWNLYVICHVNGTFQSGLRFQTGLSSLRVSCKRALDIGMVACHIKTLKSSGTLQTFLEEPMKAHKWLLLFHDHLYCFDNQCVAGDVLPSARKIRIRGSEFKFFVSIFRELEEIIIKNWEQWRQLLKIVRFFLSTISHTCGRIKPPWRAAINRTADFFQKRIEINLIRL